jgi:hypothetical protein
MLSVPLALCRALLPGSPANFVIERGSLSFSAESIRKSPLIDKNGDLEMWARLCAQDNEPLPVRVITAGSKDHDYGVSPTDLRQRAAYPADAPVGDQDGQVQVGVQPTNTAPWCIAKPGNADTRTRVETEWAAHAGAEQQPPYCPDGYVLDAQSMPANVFSDGDIDRWATRGAMNAGMSVFLYLDALAKGQKQRVVLYDHCENLTK